MSEQSESFFANLDPEVAKTLLEALAVNAFESISITVGGRPGRSAPAPLGTIRPTRSSG